MQGETAVFYVINPHQNKSMPFTACQVCAKRAIAERSGRHKAAEVADIPIRADVMNLAGGGVGNNRGILPFSGFCSIYTGR